jgi:hypothetical protein
MRRRYTRFLVLATLLVGAAVVLLGVRRPQPWAYGRSLGEWLDALPGDSRYGQGLVWDRWRLPGPEVRSAFREMSPAAFPRLQGDLASRPRPWERWTQTLRQLTGRSFGFVPDPNARRERASCAMAALGTNAIPLLPWLQTQLLTYDSAVHAAHALVGLEMLAIPAFTNALASTNAWVSDCGVWGLAQLGSAASNTMPVILPLLTRPNGADRGITLWGIAEIGEPAPLVHRALVTHLVDGDTSVQNVAREQLKRLLKTEPERRDGLRSLADDPSVPAGARDQLRSILEK